MAIRWDSEFRREIRREVDRANKKFARARKMGFAKVPKNIKSSEIKKIFGGKYATRAEVRRYLKSYSQASTRNLSKVVELESGTTVNLQRLNIAEQRRQRTLRAYKRELAQAKVREANINKKGLPFMRGNIERLENTIEILSKPARMSEAQMRTAEEYYTRKFSSAKKESFEDALFNTMDDQLERIKLSDYPIEDARMKRELKEKIRGMDVDTLIKINSEEDDFAEIMDRYKHKDEYVVEDLGVLEKAYRSIYRNIDSYIKVYTGE